jgi:hypothetical protein
MSIRGHQLLPELSAPPPHGTNGHAPAASANGKASAPLSPSADGPPSTAPPPDKDAATGRFLPGNKLGRGNPHYRRLALARSAFLDVVGPEQVRELARALLARALAGDVNAAKVVLAYAVGRPPATVDPDGADLNEWQLRQAWPHFADVLADASSLRMNFAAALDKAERVKELSEPKPFVVE